MQPDFSNQIADFNFGIDPFPGGLFWTRKVPPFVHDVDPAAGTATWRALVSCDNAGNLVNALTNGPTTPAFAVFTIKWTGGEPYELSDATERFALSGNQGTSTIEWRAWSRDFYFNSDPIDTSSSVFGAVVQERNGRFFA